MRVPVTAALLPMFLAAVALQSCAIANQVGTDPIVAPQETSVSPNMDFGRIKKLGILPIFPSGAVDDATYAEALVNALTAEVQTRQSQWEILDYREALDLITRKDLGSGYKNLQADFNTFGGPGGSFVISSATKRFFSDFQKAAGVDAVLIGTYALSVEPVQVRGLLGGVSIQNREVSRIQLTLYHAADAQNWWMARIVRAGSRMDTIDDVSKSLASNLGKGTLRQL